MTKTEQLSHTLSRKDFWIFGLDDVAFIKPVMVKGHQMYEIHAADGTPLTTVSEREVAFATVRQHEMYPHSVH